MNKTQFTLSHGSVKETNLQRLQNMLISKFIFINSFLILSTTRICFGGPPTHTSISIGPSTIGPDIGYSITLSTPYYNEKKSALAFQFDQHLFQSLSDSQYHDYNYYIFHFKDTNRLYYNEIYAFYFNANITYTFSYELTSYSNFGLAFNTGLEFYPTSLTSFYSEAGFYFPFSVRADRLQNQVYARGVAMALSIKIYL